MLTTTRQRIKLLDATVKRFGWRSMALVGVSTDQEVQALLQWCKALQLTAVWDPVPTSDPATRIRRGHMLDRMRTWAKVYPRLTVVEAPTEAAVEIVAGEFDAVVLWNVPVERLGREGALWAARVRDGGCLLGLDHRSPYVRRVLDAAVPKWEVLRDGVWLVKVRRTAQPNVAAPDADDAHGDSAPVAPDGPIGPRADGESVTHAPVDSELSDNISEPPKSTRRRPVKRERRGPSAAVADEAVGLEELDAGRAAVADAEPDGSVSITEDAGTTLAVGGSELHADTVAQPAPKRRGGRPRGSKNKPKVA